MNRLRALLLFSGVVVAGASACGDDEPPPLPQFGNCSPPQRLATPVALGSAFADVAFKSPVDIVLGPGNQFYVLEQKGTIQVVPNPGAAPLPTPAIDLSTRPIVSGGEAGLLGLAFDKDFATNGFVYLYFTAKLTEKPNIVFQDIVARFKSNDGGLTIDPTSEKILLAVDDPFPNHNGGRIAIGPDGLLYIGIGDGGSGGDPLGNGQNKEVLLGKLLRIDPNAGDPYGIPPTNPFAAGGGRPEIYAYGLRNPWKFSFDTATGDLWCADVGQNKYEEINRIVPGGNYGWNVREGKHCFSGPGCPTEGLIDPVAEYPRAEGITVIGGFVYRGSKIPSLTGKFIYGDFGSGKIWAVDGFGQISGTLLVQSNLKISTFGQDAEGEVYVADYSSGTIKQLLASDVAPSVVGAGGRLSETGCLDVKEPARPPTGAIAYNVNSPLWSDGAQKDRWVFVHEGSKVGVKSDGDFDLPPASVAVKTFTLDNRKIETRLFVRYGDGGWAGYSYEWTDDQSDAILLTDAKTKDIGNGASWYFPSPSDCFACHTPAAGFTLGLEARQLNREDVLARFAPVLEAPIAPEAFPPLRAADSPVGTTEEKARGYLHANCGICHREGGGTGAATMDLRIDRSFADTRVCNAPPAAGDLGVVDAKLMTPGDPSKSTLTLRMRALDQNRMPPVATRVVDEAGAGVVEAWIRETLACP